MPVNLKDTQIHTIAPSSFKRNALGVPTGLTETEHADQYKSPDENSTPSKRLCVPRPHAGLGCQKTLQQLVANLSALLRCKNCENLQNLRQAIS